MRLIITSLLLLTISINISAHSVNWSFETKGAIYSTPAVDKNSVYIGSDDGYIYKIDKIKGKKTWSFNTNTISEKSTSSIKSKPLVTKDRVVVSTTTGYLICIDKKSGEKIWSFKSKGEKRLDMWDYNTASPIQHENTIYWGCGEGEFYAINLHDGKIIWKKDVNTIIHADAVVDKDRVYFGDYKGNMYAYSHKGELIWKFKCLGAQYFPNAEIQRGPALHKGVLYFGSRDYNIYAIEAKSGKVFWNKREVSGWIIATPTIVDKKIIFGTSDAHKVYCLDINSGAEIWNSHVPMRVYGSASEYNKSIYFPCFDGKVHGFNYKDGKQVTKISTIASEKYYSEVYDNKGHFRKDFILYTKDISVGENAILKLGSIVGSTTIENGNIYFGSTSGRLYSVKL